MLKILLVFLVSAAVLSGGLASAKGKAPARPKYYIEVSSVREASEGGCALEDQARAEVAQALAQHASVVTDLGPAARKRPLASVLRKRRLAGFGLTLRITKCAHRLEEPRPGRRSRVLIAEVTTALAAAKIPSGQLAYATTGTAQVGSETTRIRERELKALRLEALQRSLQQSVDELISGLAEKKKRSRRAKRRRRAKSSTPKASKPPAKR